MAFSMAESHIFKMNAEQKQYLKDIYYSKNGADAYGGVATLTARIKKDGQHNITKKQLEKFLNEEEVISSHRTTHRPKHFAKIFSPRPGFALEMDTAYMPFNGPYKYFVSGIDIFSRKVSARPVKNLKADTVNKAVKSILDELGGDFRRVRTDKGTDFNNRLVQKTFKDRQIEHFIGYEPNKSSIQERFFRTIKSKLYQRMQKYGTKNWSRLLPDAISSYNQTKSRVTGLAPVEVAGANIAKAWFKMKNDDFRKQGDIKPFKFSLNDAVRVRHSRMNFVKEYNETTAPKVLYISDRFARGTNHLYALKSERNESVPGKFRSQQLQKVEISADTEYRIEKIVSRKKIRGQKYLKVKWLGWDDSYNSWVKADTVKHLKHT